MLSLERPERPATESEQQQRLRDYLRFQTFDERARVHLEDQLRSQVAQGILPAELLQYAENLLRFSKTILPPPSTLERDRLIGRRQRPSRDLAPDRRTIDAGAAGSNR